MGSIDTSDCINFNRVSRLIFPKETLEKINEEHQKLAERFCDMVQEALGENEQTPSSPAYDETLNELVNEAVRLVNFTFPLAAKLFEHLLLVKYLDQESAAKYQKLISKVNSG